MRPLVPVHACMHRRSEWSRAACFALMWCFMKLEWGLVCLRSPPPIITLRCLRHVSCASHLSPAFRCTQRPLRRAWPVAEAVLSEPPPNSTAQTIYVLLLHSPHSIKTQHGSITPASLALMCGSAAARTSLVTRARDCDGRGCAFRCCFRRDRWRMISDRCGRSQSGMR
jgi:hypothetical protein